MSYAHAPKAQMSIISNDANDAPAAYAVVAEKLKSVPEHYMEEVSEFLDFLLFRSHEETAKNGLDEAIEEVKRGEVFYYDTVDEMMADLKNA